MIQFRDLRADEIECRIQSVKPRGLVLLLYKDARCDMTILDETVGAENWQRKHKEINGSVFCSVGIRAKRGYDEGEVYEWVWKQDCGTSESENEREKTASSDSFKRACFNWGLGRCLYTSPFIWIPSSKCNIENGRCYDRFVVESIRIEKKKIMALSILNKSIWGTVDDQRCFEWSSDGKELDAVTGNSLEQDTRNTIISLADTMAALVGKTRDEVIAATLENLKFQHSYEELSVTEMRVVIARLKKWIEVKRNETSN